MWEPAHQYISWRNPTTQHRDGFSIRPNLEDNRSFRMATNTTSAAEATITSVLTPGFRGGVIFQAIIGGFSVLCLLLLLGHIIAVSFLPFCVSALNIRKNQEAPSHLSSTGASTSGDVSMSALPNRKSSSVIPRKISDDDHGYGIDLGKARAMAERRARARTREISRQSTKYNEEKLFLRMQLGVFIICMLLSDLIQSFGILIQARWAYLGVVETSTACWVQAAMLTFGDVATAVWNAVIAIHTFSTVVLGIRMSTLGITIVVIIGWSIPILMNTIGSVVIAQTQPTKPYYNVASAWCFIGNDYVTPRVVLHYVPLLFAALVITIMYALVSLTMRGNLQVTSVSRKGWLPGFSFSFRGTSVRKSTSGNTNQKQVAYLRSLSLKMLWYPCVYICLILPISICRMVELRSAKAPAEVLFFAMTLLFCVGLSNVAIYVATRDVGIHPKRNTAIHSLHPSYGPHVEIYIDRVTQNDVGVVTIGGTGLGGRDKNIRFEGVDAGDMKQGSVNQKNGSDASIRSSLERDYSDPDTKTPTSATRCRPTSPQPSPPATAYHPQYASTSPARIHDHCRSLGSVVVDRLGTPPPLQGGETPFDCSLIRTEQAVARNQSPISQFGPDTRHTYHTWEQSQGY